LSGALKLKVQSLLANMLGSAVPIRVESVSVPAYVLVVEDEALLRMAAVEMVAEAGFEALEAANATEAMEILERRLDIRIVFSDIDMPRGIDGMKLAP
jgi:CheY-like chemotaxis protein